MMRAEVVSELRTWTLEERLKVAEELLRLIRAEVSKESPPSRRGEERRRMKKAAAALLQDYSDNEELTSFTALDSEDFHAAG